MCSSRSAASSPAPRRTATNISDSVTDTAPAYEESGVRLPLTNVCLTSIGLAIDCRIGPERSRLSTAICEKRDTRSSASRSAEPGGKRVRVASRMFFVVRRPSTSMDWPSRSKEPPSSSTLRYCAAVVVSFLERAWLASARRASTTDLT